MLRVFDLWAHKLTFRGSGTRCAACGQKGVRRQDNVVCRKGGQNTALRSRSGIRPSSRPNRCLRASEERISSITVFGWTAMYIHQSERRSIGSRMTLRAPFLMLLRTGGWDCTRTRHHTSANLIYDAARLIAPMPCALYA